MFHTFLLQSLVRQKSLARILRIFWLEKKNVLLYRMFTFFSYIWFQKIICFSQYGGEAGKLAILAFPCNQFGAQEPGSKLF